jgi:MYXO-CTERM domain-containing protein
MSSDSVSGEFLWSQHSNGDGLAWAGLGALDEMSVSFSEYGGEGLENGFQFVTWNGEAWQVVATAGGFIEGGFSFSATVIPLPAALGMGLVGLAAVAVRRRRSQIA